MAAPNIPAAPNDEAKIGIFQKSYDLIISPKHLNRHKFVPQKVAIDMTSRTIGTLIFFLR